MSSTTATLAIGDWIPGLATLVGAAGERYTLASFAETELLVVVFVANGCPTVRLCEERLVDIHHRFGESGVGIVLVNSNNPHLSPPDTAERVAARASSSALPFPYLKDPEGALARSWGAVCTPHAFVVDGDRRLRYRGRIDDSRTGGSVTSRDLADAIVDLLSDRSVPVPETLPFGCAIVW
ncbi:MAG: thioredoxin family protein [Acidimicrobiales bacterium]